VRAPDVVFEGYHLPTLAKLAQEMGTPRWGTLAAIIWQLSSKALPVEVAMDFMHAAGYVPFKGYPLERSKK
jgi:hypothetical protein